MKTDQLRVPENKELQEEEKQEPEDEGQPVLQGEDLGRGWQAERMSGVGDSLVLARNWGFGLQEGSNRVINRSYLLICLQKQVSSFCYSNNRCDHEEQGIR